MDCLSSLLEATTDSMIAHDVLDSRTVVHSIPKTAVTDGSYARQPADARSLYIIPMVLKLRALIQRVEAGS